MNNVESTKTKSTEEIIKEHGYLPCLLTEKSDCMGREKDDEGFYRKCGMCAIANNAMALDSHITGTLALGEITFTDWHKMNKLKLYEDSVNIDYMKGLFELMKGHHSAMKDSESAYEHKRDEMRRVLLAENE